MSPAYRAADPCAANNYTASIMWCPSVSLSVWANAWLAGVAAPDDVLDALSQWAPRHSVTAYDSVAAGRTGLPWPDLDDAGAVSLLQTLRTAAGPPRRRAGDLTWCCRCPATSAGCRRAPSSGATPSPPGEAIIVRPAAAPRSGWCPISTTTTSADDRRRFRAAIPNCARCRGRCTRCRPRRAPSTSISARPSSTLRSAVRSAADALGALRAGAPVGDVADPRGLVEQVLESTRAHRHARPRPDSGAAGAGERGPRRRDHHRQLAG